MAGKGKKEDKKQGAFEELKNMPGAKIIKVDPKKTKEMLEKMKNNPPIIPRPGRCGGCDLIMTPRRRIF